MNPALLITFLLAVQTPLWETDIGYLPFSDPLLASAGEGAMHIFVAMGDHGLGGWTGYGEPLEGFPLSGNRGVSRKPAALHTPRTGHVVVYADNSGHVHMVDHSGVELQGWPVFAGTAVITGISVVTLREDMEPGIAFGTADGGVHLLDIYGRPYQGWPVELPARLQWQPSSLSLGGNSAFGLVCALVDNRIYVLTADGTVLPGWPLNIGSLSGSIPITADIDSDGLGNVIFATHNGRVYAVSHTGAGSEGWPFFLNARPAQGGLAAGNLDPDVRGLQVAVSSVDGYVTLLDSRGSISGTWRWPNFTRGRPTSPIIARTSEGPGVIVGCDSGYVYAWNARGVAAPGFPVDFGQPVTRTPAAGDLTGDGNTELAVLGRRGRMAVYRLSTVSTDTGCWPQPLSDEANSGTYGIHYLPVARPGDIPSMVSGDVELPYEIEGGNVTGITLSYSTDAGYTWTETSSFRDTGSSAIWFSGEDLPGMDLGECMLRITPHCPDSPGISGMSGIFRVDNNEPPILHLVAMEEQPEGGYRVFYSVEDRERDVVSLEAGFSVDSGLTWRDARLSGSTMEIPPWLYGEPVFWEPAEEVQTADLPKVLFRMRAADNDPGPWSLTSLDRDSEMTAAAQMVTPSGEVSGRIPIGVRIPNPKMDPLKLSYEYSIDGGQSWREATVRESSMTVAASYHYEIIWESEEDIPGMDVPDVRFRAAPPDTAQGAAASSPPFHVDNNIPPSVRITSPGRWDHFSGAVPVSFEISDPEGDSVFIMLEYRIEGTARWVPATGLIHRGYYPHSAYRSSLTWNAAEDLPGMERLELRIRLGASDGDTTFSAEVGPLSIDNARLPSVMQAAVRDHSPDRGSIEISYELSDPRERTLDLLVSFSTDGGVTWAEAAVSGDIYGRQPVTYQGRFTWSYGTDLSGYAGRVLLKITPMTGTTMGAPRVLQPVLS